MCACVCVCAGVYFFVRLILCSISKLIMFAVTCVFCRVKGPIPYRCFYSILLLSRLMALNVFNLLIITEDSFFVTRNTRSPVCFQCAYSEMPGRKPRCLHLLFALKERVWTSATWQTSEHLGTKTWMLMACGLYYSLFTINEPLSEGEMKRMKEYWSGEVFEKVAFSHLYRSTCTQR